MEVVEEVVVVEKEVVEREEYGRGEEEGFGCSAMAEKTDAADDAKRGRRARRVVVVAELA